MSVTLTGWGAQPGGPDPTEPEPAASDAAPAGTEFSVLAALAELPAELVDEAPLVTMGDVAAVTEAAGLTRPDPATSEDFERDYLQWMSAITGLATTPPSDDDPQYAPAMVVPPNHLVQTAAMVEDLDAAVGFTLADVDWFADVAAAPSAFTVYAGPFDDSTLPTDLTPVADGIVSLGEGDDFTRDDAGVTPLSRVGMPQRLAQRDGRIAVSPDTTLVRDWLDGAGEPDVDADVLAVATALDDAGVSSAALATLSDIDDALGPRVTPEQREAVLERLGDAVLDDAFEDAVGIGWRAVDGMPQMAIAFALDDTADADAAAQTVREVLTDGVSFQTGVPLSDYITLDEVTTDGTVVIATVRPGPDGQPAILLSMLLKRDLPFVTLDD